MDGQNPELGSDSIATVHLLPGKGKITFALIRQEGLEYKFFDRPVNSCSR